mmetsp:Transcript_10793/g.25766  ORF Transcript_10793/g.25766 Transcript_10793/m.25766 type:complete len:359 (-) Transcript_10793:931-2007(-)
MVVIIFENKPQLKYTNEMNPKYVRTIPGLFHGLSSIIALVFANYLFITKIILNINNFRVDDNGLTFSNSVILHVSNFGSALVTGIFFWDKVQSWQLSTTSTKGKGLTAQTLQNFNRGRGVIVMMMFSAFPLVCHTMGGTDVLPSTSYLLQDRIFSVGFASAMIVSCFKAYQLIEEYSQVLFLVYGASLLGLSTSISYHGTIEQLLTSHPYLLDLVEKESFMVISCVQVGFMLYYLYSRRLVSKSTVQNICRVYHPTVAIIYVVRLQLDGWWKSTNLPYPMMIQPALLTLIVVAKLFSIVPKELKRAAAVGAGWTLRLQSETRPPIETFSSSSPSSESKPRGSSNSSIIRVQSVLEDKQ